MQRPFRSVSVGILTIALGAILSAALAQTPAQMEYDRQQREYRLQMQRQQEEQQRQQQLMQENARRQQEESRRANTPQGQGSAGQGSAGQGGAPMQGRSGGGAAADQLSAARARWEKQPPLPPDKNPLLGKWTRPASSQANSSDPFAQLAALAKGGLCEVLFGGGVFEFKTDRLVGKDQRTPEQELDRVEYRGDAKHVVVLPKTTIKLMEWDFEGPNRINWKSQNCVLVRAGPQQAQAGASAGTAAASTGAAASASAATTASASTGAAASASARAEPVRASNGGGKLDLSVVALAPGHNIAGRKLWVLKEDAQVALIKGGVQSTPDASVLQNWIGACQSHTPLCEKGANALKAYSVGLATTDATGHALTPPLPAGRYWVLADAKLANKRVVWNQPVDVKGGDKSLTLDARNAMPVD
ncbi:MAG TPA: hypothetical protein VFJ68_06325 [Casimicrobiaceae bacterium]|nr:hypothetical protein [Casimicrobiaceae bacterium]